MKIGLELLLITVAVFLALLADQWRERLGNREVAEQSLRRFKQEMQYNRDQVLRVKDYHADMRRNIRAYLEAPTSQRGAIGLRLQGIQIAWFEDTAWELALATESLAHLDQDLAFSLARIYNMQRGYLRLTQGLLDAMYQRPLTEDLERFLHSLLLYYDDIVGLEPDILKLYDDVLPRIDAALAR